MLGIKYRLPSRMEKLTKEQLNKAGLKGKMPVNAYLDFASNGYALVSIYIYIYIYNLGPSIHRNGA